MNTRIWVIVLAIVLIGGYLFVQQGGAPNVSEEIVGSWQSIDDEKFTREFKADGTAIDIYDGERMTGGTWRVFTSEEPVDVAFTLEEGATYVQMIAEEDGSLTLNFKVSKLTREELDLIYMDRGGTLQFTRVQ